MDFEDLVDRLRRYPVLAQFTGLSHKKSMQIVMQHRKSFESLEIEPHSYWKQILAWLWSVLHLQQEEWALKMYDEEDLLGTEFSEIEDAEQQKIEL